MGFRMFLWWKLAVILFIFLVISFTFLTIIFPISTKFLETETFLEGENISDGITVKELLTTLQQNDTRIVNYIRRFHLNPPSKLPYNLSHPEIGVDGGPDVKFTTLVRQILKNKVL